MDAIKIFYPVVFFAIMASMAMFASCFIIKVLFFGHGGRTVELRENMEIKVILFIAILLLTFASLCCFASLLLVASISSSIGKDTQPSRSAVQRKRTDQCDCREESRSDNVTCVETHKSVAEIIPNVEDIPKICLKNQYDKSFVASNHDQLKTNLYSEQGVHRELGCPRNSACVSQEIHSVEDEILSGGLVHTSFSPSTRENVRVGTGMLSGDGQVTGFCEPLKSSTTSPSMMHGCKKSTISSIDSGAGSGREATCGLSRGVRKQVAAILDEFWGHFFDYHGILAEEAKFIRADMVLDLALDPSTEVKLSAFIPEPSPRNRSLHADKYPVLPTAPMVYNSSVTLPSDQTAELPDLVVSERPSLSSAQQSQNHRPTGNVHGYSTPSSNRDSVGAQQLPALSESYFANYGYQLSYVLVQNGFGSSSSGFQYLLLPCYYYELTSSGTNSFWDYAMQYDPTFGHNMSSIYRNLHQGDAFAYANYQSPNLAARTEEDRSASELFSMPKHCEDDLSQPMRDHKTFGTKLLEKDFLQSDVKLTWGGLSITSKTDGPKKFLSYRETECLLIQSLRFCIRKLMRLEGSSWLFGQNGGFDEELIDYFAAAEKLLDKNDPLEENLVPRSEEGGQTIYLSIIPYCGEGCILQARLVVSFGVWCIHRILDLLVVESRPEFWGRYTYVLNRLQVRISNIPLSSPHYWWMAYINDI